MRKDSFQEVVAAMMVRKCYGTRGEGDSIANIAKASGYSASKVRHLLSLTYGKGGWW